MTELERSLEEYSEETMKLVEESNARVEKLMADNHKDKIVKDFLKGVAIGTVSYFALKYIGTSIFAHKNALTKVVEKGAEMIPDNSVDILAGEHIRWSIVKDSNVDIRDVIDELVRGEYIID